MIENPRVWTSAFWTALAFSGAFAWPVYRALVALKSRQTVSAFAPEGHQAKQGTPTMGGIIVLMGLAAGLWFSGVRDGATWLATFGFAGVGFSDDFLVPRLWPGKRGLGWKQKLVFQAAFASGAVAMWPTPLGGFEVALCVLAILFFANAYNFADGLDGLAGTLAVLIALGIAGIAWMIGEAGVAAGAAALAGATLPFLFLNAPPAKLFMGDVGALGIGALIGVCVTQIATSPLVGVYPAPAVGGVAPALVVISLLLVAELLPVPLQIFWVKAFKQRLFPYTPIHHAFEKAGWPETRVVVMFCLVQAVLAAAAVSYVYWGWLGAKP